MASPSPSGNPRRRRGISFRLNDGRRSGPMGAPGPNDRVEEWRAARSLELVGDAGVEVEVEREVGDGEQDVGPEREREAGRHLVKETSGPAEQYRSRRDGVDAGLVAQLAAVVDTVEGGDVADLTEPGDGA